MCIIAAPLQAHEFWIEAEDYTVAPGAEVVARFRNGQELVGSALSYIPGRAERFDMIAGGDMTKVPARIGDNPAFRVADLPEGLLTILHVTTDQFVTYSEWAKWVKFTEHKDFAFTQQAHLDRGLPQEEFRERYRRHAKALVAVGDGAGSDAARGLLVEFVAGANPYTDDLSDGLPVQILFDGAPRPGAQIEMFEKDATGEVAVTLHKADADGRAVLPVRPGREYLLDHVVILPLEPEEARDPVWQTHWAALTFAVPEG
ncbi:DUF4198 domain-containing protein [Jannaschia sp. S6380]|uniref:DUF4198 domain-containing protein n=1 Tax=Jannaschia sp. S6380 TaxID=2926408 RepID=UPI001FF521B1|nr:DUF4198 domain-containing protein [Jannaschia sp. S6380]MCK0168355.1 DUF4198 domain-containing protein [Jannaschia sp. S6380]